MADEKKGDKFGIVYFIVLNVWLLALTVVLIYIGVKYKPSTTHYIPLEKEEKATPRGAFRYNFESNRLEIYDEVYEFSGTKLRWKCADFLLREELGINSIKRYFVCLEDGEHKLKFDSIKDEFTGVLFYAIYNFKCEKCGRTITKEKDDLTCKEKKSLKVLGLYGDKE